MASNISGKLKSLCKNLGENCKPTYVVMAIATVKGICRPTFTMMDKHEDYETKKYTAIREGLTEVIAIPVYWGLGELSGKCAKFLPEELQKQGKKNAMFLGVCVAALLIIPGLCSATIKPIMDKFFPTKKDEKKVDKNLDVTSLAPQLEPVAVVGDLKLNINQKPTLQTFVSRPQSGMRVGGV